MSFRPLKSQFRCKKISTVKFKDLSFNSKHVTSLLSDTLQIPIFIFCSIDTDKLDLELLVRRSEPYCQRGFSGLLLLDLALYFPGLLSIVTTFKGVTSK